MVGVNSSLSNISPIETNGYLRPYTSKDPHPRSPVWDTTCRPHGRSIGGGRRKVISKMEDLCKVYERAVLPDLIERLLTKWIQKQS